MIVKGDLFHSWDVSPAEAREIQLDLRNHVDVQDRFKRPLRWLAGVDVGFEEKGAVTRAGVVVLDALDLSPVDEALSRRPTSFPYIPGLLSFREIPAVLDALTQLGRTPDVLLCDGQGIAHPRRFGIASHLGVILDLPSVGVAKSRLIGTHAAVPNQRGAWVPLYDAEDCIGAVLRTRVGVKPLYVSVGHRISLPSAVELVMGAVTGFRLPETTRRADRLASAPSRSRRLVRSV